jgi:hypothetical protein
MPFKIQKAYQPEYIGVDPADFVIRNEQDILELIAVCAENSTYNVILYEGSFSPDFFDLKTKLAGDLFQKFANYHVRGAGIISLSKIKSERFKELIFECNRGDLFRFFEDKEAAERWLAGNVLKP